MFQDDSRTIEVAGGKNDVWRYDLIHTQTHTDMNRCLCKAESTYPREWK
jgi:hypothetical protein